MPSDLRALAKAATLTLKDLDAYHAFMSPERALAMQDAIDAAKAVDAICAPEELDALRLALARFEGMR